jgi:hypothetical protein
LKGYIKSGFEIKRRKKWNYAWLELDMWV